VERNSEQYGPLQLVGGQVEFGTLGQSLRRDRCSAVQLAEGQPLRGGDEGQSVRRERGAGYLRMAGRGLPERGPGIFMTPAQVHEKAVDAESMRKALETAPFAFR